MKRKRGITPFFFKKDLFRPNSVFILVIPIIFAFIGIGYTFPIHIFYFQIETFSRKTKNIFLNLASIELGEYKNILIEFFMNY